MKPGTWSWAEDLVGRRQVVDDPHALAVVATAGGLEHDRERRDLGGEGRHVGGGADPTPARQRHRELRPVAHASVPCPARTPGPPAPGRTATPSRSKVRRCSVGTCSWSKVTTSHPRANDAQRLEVSVVTDHGVRDHLSGAVGSGCRTTAAGAHRGRSRAAASCERAGPRPRLRPPGSRRDLTHGCQSLREPSDGATTPSTSRPRSSTGAECVKAPTATKSTPVAATSAASARRKSAAGLERDGAPGRPSDLHAATQLVDVHVVEQDQVDTGVDRRRHLRRRSRTRPRAARLAPGRGSAPPPPRRHRRPATWLSLTSAASPSPMRWLRPPPHRTAYLSSSRSPGMVLRVSRTRVVGPQGIGPAPRSVSPPRTGGPGS